MLRWWKSDCGSGAAGSWEQLGLCSPLLAHTASCWLCSREGTRKASVKGFPGAAQVQPRWNLPATQCESYKIRGEIAYPGWNLQRLQLPAFLYLGRALSACGGVLAAGEVVVSLGQGLISFSSMLVKQQVLQGPGPCLGLRPTTKSCLLSIQEKRKRTFENNNSMHLILILVLKTTWCSLQRNWFLKWMKQPWVLFSVWDCWRSDSCFASCRLWLLCFI